MKSLNTLLKSILKGKNSPKRINPDENPGSDNQPNLSTLKQNQDERETDENSRCTGLDNSDAGKDSRTDEKCQTADSSDGAGNYANRESLKDNSSSVRQETVEEAYRRGLIDGRNSKIEELYFPNLDDGIPHFRGCPSNEIKSDDIFSVAREA